MTALIMKRAEQSLKIASLLTAWLLCSVALAAAMNSFLAVLPITASLLALLYWYNWTVEEERSWSGLVGAAVPAAPGVQLADTAFADHFIAREFSAAERGRALALVMFRFNEVETFAAEHGSRAADDAVHQFADLLNRSTRRMNLTARYGWRGDTFMSVLSDATMPAAEAYVARMRSAAAARGAPMPRLDVGIAVYMPAMRSPEELVQAAQHALDAARAAPTPYMVA